MKSQQLLSNILILTGPTGAGKTELSLAVAERCNAEIVAMDSMTLYRGMDIGTAKPTLAERSRIPHHLIDVLDPWESASAAWWLEQSILCCRQIEERGKRVLFVGGTPLYLKLLLYGMFEGPPADPALRDRLRQKAELAGAAELHKWLALIDPAAGQRIHPNDERRIIRALEVFELTGKPISQWQVQWQAGQTPSLTSPPGGEGRVRGAANRAIWLDLPRAELYDRINRRVERMFNCGLVDEVAALCRHSLPLSREAAQALGYKEVLEYLAGRATLDETIGRVKTRSRQFAKRQLTWFRSLPLVQPVSNELTSVFAAFRID